MEYKKIDRSNLGKGEYADFFKVWHDFVAFYLDYGQVGTKDDESVKVFSRIITSPLGARLLVSALWDALNDYSGRFGEIRDEEGRVFRDDEFQHGNK